MKVLYAGTFNPLTVGHLSVIRQAQKMGMQVIVGAGSNPDKKSHGNIDLIKRDVPANTEVIAMDGSQYTANIAKNLGCDALIRGIRGLSDLDSELVLAQENRRIAGISTMFIPADPQYSHVSSSFVKAMVGPKGWEEAIKGYVPPAHYNRMIADHLKLPKLLVGKYTEAHRHYHTAVHINDCIAWLERAKNEDEYLKEYWPLYYDTIYRAILWHDAVYVPGNTDNEDNSVYLFKDYGLSDSRSRDKEVIEFILATKTHSVPEKASNALKLFLDIDMSILGADLDRYIEYTHQIRKEYSMLSNPDYYDARERFLRDLLERPRIFHSDYFHNLLEEKARRNIDFEIFNIMPQE